MKRETQIVSLGRDPKDNHGIVNPPVYHASTILFPNLDAYEAGERGEYHLPTYGRHGTPSTIALEKALATLEGADHAILTASGISAVAMVLMGMLNSGDQVLLPDTIYGPARRFSEQELKRYGVEITYYDPMIGADIGALIKANTKLVYVESPGSLTFEVQDIPAICKAAHAKGVPVAGDNTWATFYHSRPYDLGLDITIHSATKYIAGHSDLIMGLITCKKEYFEKIQRSFRNVGACVNANDCYFAQRGLRTMHVRLKQHQETGIELANWLKKRPEVVKVLHPALPDCPGHDIWKRDFTGACGLFSVLIKSYPRKALAAMVDHLEHFGMGYSWGGYESLLIPFSPKMVRSVTPWKHDGLSLRIHAGLEHIDDLIQDLDAGFKRLQAAS